VMDVFFASLQQAAPSQEAPPPDPETRCDEDLLEAFAPGTYAIS
jgi:hypothetical protein